MAIEINWKTVATVIVFISIFAIVQYSYPVLSPRMFSPGGRQLMTEETCRELEEQLDYLQSLMKSNEQRSLDTLERLRAQNNDIRKKLDVQREIVKDLEQRNKRLIDKLAHLETGGVYRKEGDNRLAPTITQMTLRTLNIQQETEFEIIPYESFSKDRLYQLDSGMINKPETSAIGDKKREITEVEDTALEMLNHGNPGKHFTMYDLLLGYMRIERTQGTQYELYFREKNKKNVFQHVSMFRPYAPLQKVKQQTYDKQNEWINLIMPLAGRLDTLAMFLEMFVETCIETDKRVFLTVVYFGEEGKSEAKRMIETMAAENHYEHYKFVEKQEEFSRGRGLLAGAEACDQGNVLMFFCDVDVFFDASFLHHCRLNAAPGAKVYYPIVFSLFNPSIVYSDEQAIPLWREQLVLNRDSGFWRTFGFGMTCMYRSDFLFMRGFDTKIQGWGYEDVKLYRKFVQSNFEVVRATDSTIFHLWHEKVCDPQLPPEQYTMCLGSKAIGYASHAQLGKLAFKELRQENEQLHLAKLHRGYDNGLGKFDGYQQNKMFELEEVNKQFDHLDGELF